LKLVKYSQSYSLNEVCDTVLSLGGYALVFQDNLGSYSILFDHYR